MVHSLFQKTGGKKIKKKIINITEIYGYVLRLLKIYFEKIFIGSGLFGGAGSFSRVSKASKVPNESTVINLLACIKVRLAEGFMLWLGYHSQGDIFQPEVVSRAAGNDYRQELGL